MSKANEANPPSENSKIAQHRVGGTLPKNPAVLEAWIDKELTAIKSSEPQDHELHPVIQDFKKFIEGDPAIKNLFEEMFQQVSTKPPYQNEPDVKPRVRDYRTMLRLFDKFLTYAPAFSQDNYLITYPFGAVLDWPMGTDAGYEAFMKPEVNAHFKNILNAWGEFLATPESCSVLTDADHGWFSPAASEAVPDFEATFECDVNDKHRGFKCWDDFFTRRLRPGVRPIQFPENNAIINNACESTVYRIASGIKKQDQFWLKGEPYSLVNILNNDPYVDQFVGGTIFQSYLSAANYHRWASPVNGTVRKVVNVPGTYFAEAPAIGFARPDGLSQAFLVSVATRALIFIEGDDPNVGLMCFIAVGMAEVSTCEITVKEGQRVKKGDETGMFHFGGSTHCLVFRPETKLTFAPEYGIGKSVPLNAAIATVSS